MSADIHSLPPGRKAALSRNRKEALPAIREALLSLSARAVYLSSYTFSHAVCFHRSTDTRITFDRRKDGDVHCRVYRRNKYCFAWRIPTSADKPHAGPQPWIRGWEAALFDLDWEAVPRDPSSLLAPVHLRPKRRRRPSREVVIPWSDAAALACGRDRDLAKRAIYRRLKQLHRQAAAKPDAHNSYVWVGSLCIWYNDEHDGVYFQVSTTGETLMTGYLDPDQPGAFVDGVLHVMTWRPRGWEGELFKEPVAKSPARYMAGLAGPGGS